ncbi:alpha-tubulin suppressor-like RCC1 family protein [Paenibacillus mucilaginosus]|uniref:RCC1 domain-containing protein n=1 Tax=Paenibacillus mucilaginosus TaxID=61624 RepID=UPI003D1D7CF3
MNRLSKEVSRWAVILCASALLTLPTAASAASQAGVSSAKPLPKVEQVVDPAFPMALDDQGQVWAKALNTISVKDGFHPTVLIRGKGLDRVSSVASNGGVAVALREDGSVWTINRITPASVNDHVSVQIGERLPKLEGIVKVVLSGTLGLAMDKKGDVWAFEIGFHVDRGQTVEHMGIMPVHLPALKKIKDLSFGSTAITFLKEDGTVSQIPYTYRESKSSMYTTLRTDSPEPVKGMDGIVKLSKDSALTRDGRVWLWGDGVLAKPDHDVMAPAAKPFQVSGLDDVADFAAGGEHALFIKKDGTVWAWGYFSHNPSVLGELQPKVYRELSPIEGLSDASSVIVHGEHGGDSVDIVVKKDGSLWMWGADESRRIHTAPLQVGFRHP